jgi:hypothetical protein
MIILNPATGRDSEPVPPVFHPYSLVKALCYPLLTFLHSEDKNISAPSSINVGN